jgi:hypothetical protein
MRLKYMSTKVQNAILTMYFGKGVRKRPSLVKIRFGASFVWNRTSLLCLKSLTIPQISTKNKLDISHLSLFPFFLVHHVYNVHTMYSVHHVHMYVFVFDTYTSARQRGWSTIIYIIINSIQHSWHSSLLASTVTPIHFRRLIYDIKISNWALNISRPYYIK